ncbi:hypothetical protein RKD30_001854 [Streptomyces pristinaespiralis]
MARRGRRPASAVARRDHSSPPVPAAARCAPQLPRQSSCPPQRVRDHATTAVRPAPGRRGRPRGWRDVRASRGPGHVSDKRQASAWRHHARGRGARRRAGGEWRAGGAGGCGAAPSCARPRVAAPSARQVPRRRHARDRCDASHRRGCANAQPTARQRHARDRRGDAMRVAGARQRAGGEWRAGGCGATPSCARPRVAAPSARQVPRRRHARDRCDASHRRGCANAQPTARQRQTPGQCVATSCAWPGHVSAPVVSGARAGVARHRHAHGRAWQRLPRGRCRVGVTRAAGATPRIDGGCANARPTARQRHARDRGASHARPGRTPARRW